MSKSKKVEPFADLIGKVPNDKIAEMAGVEPADVEAYGATPQVLSEILGVSEADVRSAIDVVQPTPRPSAPSCVRVVVGRANLAGPDGRTFKIHRRDIFTGEQAAWLWHNHQALVEPYQGPV